MNNLRNNNSDCMQFGAIHDRMISRQPCSDEEEQEVESQFSRQQFDVPNDQVRKKFWYDDYFLDGIVEGEAVQQNKKAYRGNNNFMTPENDEDLMDIEESDQQYMQQFGHMDVLGLYPQFDLNYGSSLQRLFNERSVTDKEHYNHHHHHHHQGKNINKKVNKSNNPARKCSLAFLSENKQQQEDDNDRNHFNLNYPPPSPPQSNNPLSLLARNNLFFQPQSQQPVQKGDDQFRRFEIDRQRKTRFLNLIEDQTTLNLCIQQAKEKMNIDDINYRECLKNQHSLESLSSIFSKALTQVLVQKSQYSPDNSMSNFTPNSMKPAEPPIMVSDYELQSQLQFNQEPKSIQKTTFFDRKSTVTSNTCNNKSLPIKGSKWTKEEVSYLEKILEQIYPINNNSDNQVTSQSTDSTSIDWNKIANIFGRSVLQVFKKGKKIILKLENRLNKKLKPLSKNNARLDYSNNQNGNSLQPIQQDQQQKKGQLSNQSLIHLAIQRLPSKCGTKIQIFQQIKGLQKEMNIPPRRQSSLQQTLSTKFKKIPGTFSLTKLGADNVIKQKEKVANLSMKIKVMYVLSHRTDYTATLQQIKESIILDFQTNLNCNQSNDQLSVWETTLLKVLTSNKAEIDNSRSKGLYTFLPKYLSSIGVDAMSNSNSSNPYEDVMSAIYGSNL